MNDPVEIPPNHFPIECPNPTCGATGSVPINRLDRQLSCKTCGGKFYLGADGTRLIIGERPENLGASNLHHVNYRKITTLPIEKLEQKWRSLPKKSHTAIKASLAGVALIGFLLSIVIPMLRPRPTFAKDLNQRAMLVASAFIRGDRNRLAALTEWSTVSRLDEWLEKVRPKEWETSRPILEVNTTIISNNPRSPRATVIVTLSEPRPSEPQSLAEEEPETVAPAGDAIALDADGKPEAPKGATEEPAPDESSDAPGTMPARGKPGDPGEGAADGEASTPAPAEIPPDPSPPKPARKVQLTLHWTNVGNNEWLLDLTETLKHAF